MLNLQKLLCPDGRTIFHGLLKPSSFKRETIIFLLGETKPIEKITLIRKS